VDKAILQQRALGIVFITILCGCGGFHSATNGTATSIPESLILYSLDGNDRVTTDDATTSEGSTTKELFHGFTVLGKLEITDSDKRVEVMRSLLRAIERSDGKVASCFWPRHGIRVVENSKTIDYVICFQCLRLEIHEDGNESTKPVTRDPQQNWNRILKTVGVTLAPQ